MKHSKQLRYRLFHESPFCHWCNILTLLIDFGSAKPEQRQRVASVDHVKCKAEADSWAEYVSPANKVLACHKCNAQRNDRFLKSHRYLSKMANAGKRLSEAVKVVPPHPKIAPPHPFREAPEPALLKFTRNYRDPGMAGDFGK